MRPLLISATPEALSRSMNPSGLTPIPTFHGALLRIHPEPASPQQIETPETLRQEPRNVLVALFLGILERPAHPLQHPIRNRLNLQVLEGTRGSGRPVRDVEAHPHQQVTADVLAQDSAQFSRNGAARGTLAGLAGLVA